MAFKKGDKVRVKVGQAKYNLPEGSEWVVDKAYHDGVDDMVNVHNDKGELKQGFYARRFELIEDAKPEILAFAVGAQVERTAGSTTLIVKGEKYVIREIQYDALGGVEYLKLEGFPIRYHVSGFKLVANAKPAKEFNRDDWIPQEGEKVYITGKDRYSNGATMDALIDNGIIYSIYRVERERIYLNEVQWMYTKESLTPQWAIKNQAKPVLKELRKALYDHQGKTLGEQLCAFAFEGKAGNQVFWPYVCHAKLNNDMQEIVKMAYGFRHDMKRAANNKATAAHLIYSNYIISQSPWKGAFITQSLEEAVTKDILMNVEVNRYVMAGACVALRTGQEYPDRPVIFKEMLELGHHPHTCWLVSCAFTKDGENYSFRGWDGSHDVIDKHRNFEEVIRFFKEGYFREAGKNVYGQKFNDFLTTNPFRTHHTAYAVADPIASRVDEGEKGSIKDWFVEHTKAEKIGEGWKAKTRVTKQSLDAVASELDKLIKG